MFSLPLSLSYTHTCPVCVVYMCTLTRHRSGLEIAFTHERMHMCPSSHAHKSLHAHAQTPLQHTTTHCNMCPCSQTQERRYTHTRTRHPHAALIPLPLAKLSLSLTHTHAITFAVCPFFLYTHLPVMHCLYVHSYRNRFLGCASGWSCTVSAFLACSVSASLAQTHRRTRTISPRDKHRCTHSHPILIISV